MTHSHAPVQVGLRIGRWLLPWVAVVFVSATLAYAINGAIAADPSAGDRWPAAQLAGSTGEATGPTAVEQSTPSPSALSADLGPSVTPERCEPIGSGYMDSSIVAESRRIACGQGAP
jgi:hypothetical protein